MSSPTARTLAKLRKEGLYEADVVEKQRAREIYETILREKRDPGLLEWTGGNLFKARVFPIEAHSEKRIKIVYTQVLPLRAGVWLRERRRRRLFAVRFPVASVVAAVSAGTGKPARTR